MEELRGVEDGSDVGVGWMIAWSDMMDVAGEEDGKRYNKIMRSGGNCQNWPKGRH